MPGHGQPSLLLCPRCPHPCPRRGLRLAGLHPESEGARPRPAQQADRPDHHHGRAAARQGRNGDRPDRRHRRAQRLERDRQGLRHRGAARTASPSRRASSTTRPRSPRRIASSWLRSRKCLTEGALKGRQRDAHRPRRPARRARVQHDARRQPRRHRQALHGRPRRRSRAMLATSRGEMDATGTNEASWAHDRRVDVELVQVALTALRGRHVVVLSHAGRSAMSCRRARGAPAAGVLRSRCAGRRARARRHVPRAPASRRAHRRDRGVSRAEGPRVSCARRHDEANAHALRAAGARVRVPHLRHVRLLQRRVLRGGEGARGARSAGSSP